MEIKGNVIFPEGHDTKYVNGAFGSMNNRGEFLIHFFRDLNTLPDSVTIKIENNKLHESYPITNDFDRKVVSSIILSPDNAKKIASWILKHIERSELAQSEPAVKE
jgi:hypothetical protein